MSASNAARKEDIPIPEIVIDPSTGSRYMKGKFLGKGGFARCYELTEMQTKDVFAGKIVSKQLLTKQHQKEKVIENFIKKKTSFFYNKKNEYLDDSRNSYTPCCTSQTYS
jgi:hypothetical protein